MGLPMDKAKIASEKLTKWLGPMFDMDHLRKAYCEQFGNRVSEDLRYYENHLLFLSWLTLTANFFRIARRCVCTVCSKIFMFSIKIRKTEECDVF